MKFRVKYPGLFWALGCVGSRLLRRFRWTDETKRTSLKASGTAALPTEHCGSERAACVCYMCLPINGVKSKHSIENCIAGLVNYFLTSMTPHPIFAFCFRLLLFHHCFYSDLFLFLLLGSHFSSHTHKKNWLFLYC